MVAGYESTQHFVVLVHTRQYWLAVATASASTVLSLDWLGMALSYCPAYPFCSQ
nr:MAG TPA: cuticle protein [Caudoviricetes sp.]